MAPSPACPLLALGLTAWNACSAGLQVKTKHGKHENFVAPKPAGRDGKGGVKDAAKCFGIRHYAGEVGRP